MKQAGPPSAPTGANATSIFPDAAKGQIWLFLYLHRDPVYFLRSQCLISMPCQFPVAQSSFPWTL